MMHVNWDFLAGALIVVAGGWGLSAFAIRLAMREAARRRRGES